MVKRWQSPVLSSACRPHAGAFVPYCGLNAPDERPTSQTEEWQSSFSTSYTHSERYGGTPLVDRDRYTAQEAPSDRGGTHPCEER